MEMNERITNKRNVMLDEYDLSIKFADSDEKKTMWEFGKAGYMLAYDEILEMLKKWK